MPQRRHRLNRPIMGLCPAPVYYLQSEKPFNADVVGQLKQRVKVLVLTQWFAIYFDAKC